VSNRHFVGERKINAAGLATIAQSGIKQPYFFATHRFAPHHKCHAANFALGSRS
jgi:hypothetical protein